MQKCVPCPNVDMEFFSKKKVDECPPGSEWLPELARIDVMSAPVQEMIRELVQRRAAVTRRSPFTKRSLMRTTNSIRG